MRLLASFFLIFTLNAAEFKSYDAEFVFETKYGSFPLKRFFAVEGDKINTKVKMELLWFKYSLDSNFKIENQQIVSIDTFVRDPFRDRPKKFKASFSKNGINSQELGNFKFTGSVLEQLSSDVQVRLNAKYGVKSYQLKIFDNTKAKVVTKDYRQLENEIVSTSFGDIETIVVIAESEDVGPIKYFIAPSLDHMIIKSTATLKDAEERVLIVSEKPKFSEE
jgi:hypothetical protein|tara:strand:- start:244 stop:906 length:663 start_codon:yes stop_codon:yes gene_type:complete